MNSTKSAHVLTCWMPLCAPPCADPSLHHLFPGKGIPWLLSWRVLLFLNGVVEERLSTGKSQRSSRIELLEIGLLSALISLETIYISLEVIKTLHVLTLNSKDPFHIPCQADIYSLLTVLRLILLFSCSAMGALCHQAVLMVDSPHGWSLKSIKSHFHIQFIFLLICIVSMVYIVIPW